MPSTRKAAFFIYGVSFFYNFSMSMIYVLVPLYTIHLGFNPLQIGLIVSSQALLQILLRLFGGILSDIIGEKPILWFSFACMGTASFLFAISGTSIWILIAIQLIMGASRSVYWASSQSYASRIDSERKTSILSHHTSVINVGMVLGFFGGGVFSDLFGFTIAFLIGSALGYTALAGSIIMPTLPKVYKKVKGIREFLSPIPELARNRVLYLAGLAAFVSAFLIAMAGSIYPVYFRELGYSGTEIGFFTSIRPVGIILIGFVFSYLLARMGNKWMFALGVGGTGLVIAATPFLESFWMFTLLFLVMGVPAGCATILYQTLVADNSRDDERGMAFSFAGLAWGFSQLTVPSFFGFLANTFGIAEAFWIGGGLLILISLSTVPLFRLLLPQKPQESVVEPPRTR